MELDLVQKVESKVMEKILPSCVICQAGRVSWM